MASPSPVEGLHEHEPERSQEVWQSPPGMESRMDSSGEGNGQAQEVEFGSEFDGNHFVEPGRGRG